MFVLLKAIWMIYRNVFDKGDNPVEDLNIYNVWKTIDCYPVYNPFQPEVC